MKYKRYDKYKETGVEWLNEIPESWEVKRNKFSASYQKGKNPSELGDYVPNSLPYLSMEYLRGNSNEAMQFAIPSSREVISEEGDILLLWDGANAGEYIKSKSGILCSTTARAKVKKNVTSSFYWFLMKSFERNLRGLTIGMGIPHVNGDVLNNSSIPLPPIHEQKEIADYLDKKTSKIDLLLKKLERQKELLVEKRSAIINKAVTRGLNPDAKMKKTGIEWMSEVPKHWKVKRLKFIASFNSGENITSDSINETGDYKVYGGNGLRGYTSNYTHDGHFVLIGRQGALCGNINYAKGKFWASEHAVVSTLVSEYDIFWFGEVLRIMNLNQYSQSSAQPGLAVDYIKNLFIPVPTQDEQKAISEYLDKQTTKIDLLQSKTDRQIELLKEYRTSLIASAVTGQIKITSSRN
ncbi:MAG: restriction endonuclease subunit S [Pseudomonadota bacterium]